MRRAWFGRFGPFIVAGVCGWELGALVSRDRVPTVSHVVRAHPWFGVLLLTLLVQHWYLEREVVPAP